MRPFPTAIGTLALVAMLAPAPASAQQSGTRGPAPQLHVNDAYRSCFFDLHPELTKDEFGEFAAELGSVLRFRQLGDTTPLGRGHVDISVQFASPPIDDAKGAWNNTMSHPAADHYLGRSISFQSDVARSGRTVGGCRPRPGHRPGLRRLRGALVPLAGARSFGGGGGGGPGALSP